MCMMSQSSVEAAFHHISSSRISPMMASYHRASGDGDTCVMFGTGSELENCFLTSHNPRQNSSRLSNCPNVESSCRTAKTDPHSLCLLTRIRKFVRGRQTVGCSQAVTQITNKECIIELHLARLRLSCTACFSRN